MKVLENLINYIDERTGLKEPFLRAILHPVPKGSTWLYVFGSAIMTCLLFK